ncbi:MAG: LysR family transcriptional regulator [Pseudomonadota bacterium]
MRTRQIEIFHAIYTAGSISQAAAVLNVSQPALSKSLRLTEEQLGFALFERRAQGLVPTRKADELYESASRVMGELEHFRVALRNVALRDKALIRIAMAPSIALSVGADAIAAFAETHEQVNIYLETLHYDEVVAAIRNETIDIAVVYHPRHRRGLRIVPLATARFVCLSRKGHWPSSKQTVQLGDLKGQPLIQLSAEAPLGRILNSQIDARVVASGKAGARTIIANTYYLAQSMAARGLGLAVVDEYSAREASSDAVDCLPLDEELSFTVGAIVREEHSLSPEESLLIEHFTTRLNGLEAPCRKS